MKQSPSPRIFRVLVGARDLGRSRRFYETLLGARGRTVAVGRVYFDCGSVLLGVLDHSHVDPANWSAPSEAIYFAVARLEVIHARARRLRCLSQELLHGDPSSPMGEIVRRPWGERSFYAEDPSGNVLCFVDERTRFTGSPSQVAALRRQSPATRPRRARAADPKRRGRRRG